MTLHKQADQLHRRNLNTLKKHRVRVAVGSDEYGSTSAPEAMYLSGLKVFSNLELLKMWRHTTAETIFPKRKLGHLKDGYEASFLVLRADPIEDFAYTQKIEMRVKKGGYCHCKTESCGAASAIDDRSRADAAREGSAFSIRPLTRDQPSRYQIFLAAWRPQNFPFFHLPRW